MRKSTTAGFATRAGTARAAFMLVAITGCGRAAPPPVEDKALTPALVHYADLAYAIYDDSARGLEGLTVAVGELVAEPSALTLERARHAYLAARVPYRASEVFRFYGGPIDAVEVAVNTWPIDESFVEAGDAGAPGIIEDRAQYPELGAELIEALNARDGETAISTGYHVIEFLLWGRDVDPAGPGQRTHADFAAQGASKSARDQVALAARRATYLTVATELLAQKIAAVRDAWRADESANYRSRFLALPTRQALELALRGMGTLSGPELAGERLTVGYETKDQENEQSCFSDTTSDDVVGNAAGIESVCSGSYRTVAGERLRGPGICGAIALLDPAIADTLSREIVESVRSTRQIPMPFDQALLGSDDAPGRVAISASIRALRAQATTLSRAAALLRSPPVVASAP